MKRVIAFLVLATTVIAACGGAGCLGGTLQVHRDDIKGGQAHRERLQYGGCRGDG